MSDTKPANVYVQYKGTDICLDFTCECGAEGHFDGYYAYRLKCTKCGAIYAMPENLTPAKVEDDGSVAQEPYGEEEL